MFLMTSMQCSQNLLLKILFIISIFYLVHTSHGACNPLDTASLSSFNLSLSSSPQLNWSSSHDCCDWEGVACDGSGRVTNLSLPSRGLVGTMSPSIANLTTLIQLTLSHNWLSGPLPHNFFQSLNQLQFIDLSRNRLTGELVPLDKIPPTVRILNLSSNNFHGPIQSSPHKTSLNLEAFDVNNNSFSGPIPLAICALSPSIQRLDFSSNDFAGPVPQGLSGCINLQSLKAGFNNLSSELPEDIYQLSTLQELYLGGNSLSGTINQRILNLTSLKALSLFGNTLTGPMPKEIGRLARLERLELHVNRLNGTIPSSLADCVNLTLLNLRVNLFEGELSSFNFSNFTRLKTVDLGNNFFSGGLPRTLFSCKTLTAVRLATNRLSGEIVPEIGSLPFLSFFAVSNNSLTNLTSAIRILARCPKLSALVLAKNFYNEAFTDNDRLTGFQNIQILGLGGCNFNGQVPLWIRELYKLQVIDLSYNKFTGFVPGWFGSLPNLFYLDLSNNLLTGVFPLEFTKLPLFSSRMNSDQVASTNLELPIFIRPDNISFLQYNQAANLPPALYLGNNSITGAIPAEIGQLKYIIVLSLSYNEFSGNIPDTISSLVNLEMLDLSRNNLTGDIPASLQNLNFLSSFSVANNSLEGPIPMGGQFNTFPISSFIGNPKLCGWILQRSCSNNQSGNTNLSETGKGNKKKTIILILVISSTIFTLMVLLYFLFSKRKIFRNSRETEENDLEAISFNSSGVFPEFPKETSVVVLFSNNNGKLLDLTIDDILKGTNNFNQSNIIGCGGLGIVFKATLSDGTNLTIKKLSGDMSLMERQFKAEVEALSTAHHKNIVTLQGYCLHDRCRLLIYPYMENESLHYWLHDRPDGPSRLNWPTRLKILKGMSRGVAYMHQTCDPHIIHRDLKSSNILLDHEFEAHVADFGLARLILSYQTHVTTESVGTLGYIPPEYSQSWMATLRGDMYSFGVVMLELLARKRPMEMSRPRVSKDLAVWAQEMREEGNKEEIIDIILRGKGFEQEMLQVLDVACMCVSKNPLDRPTIKEVNDLLENLGSNLNKEL